MSRPRSGERREEILQVLARMLQESPGEHITTAALAKSVGVSEAALYRHFPSKARMFESLIEFIEESVFSRITRILAEEPKAEARVQQILALVLGFAEKNPGMARLLQGGVLTGETSRLLERIAQFYERIETQLRQVLRDGALATGTSLAVNDAVRLLLAVVEGRIALFVRSDFKLSPAEGWEQQWLLLRAGIFKNS
jgi:TetR/AcrR family transcriptional regulator